jgi:ATP-binding cassette subfamily A (ABC1) protein 3
MNTSNYGELRDEAEMESDEVSGAELDSPLSPIMQNDVENQRTGGTGVHIDHISKEYTTAKWVVMKDVKRVVDDLSLNIHQGEIFALLGANGAGKTTTIKMLTGLIPPTSGNAYVNGLNILDDMDAIRQQMGICPQENLIFDKLSVQEHLRIYGVIKGVPFSGLQQEIDTRLEQVGLLEEKKNKASDLSGGMKRRMCIAIALIGDPRVIILDEPTSGLDPLSRRKIWELLQKNKHNKTIILTTHSMEEADVLGDGGIAILKKGKLEVAGNSLSLKNHYGIGYNLHLAKKQNSDSFDVEQVKQFVHEHVADAQYKETTESHVVFLLPYQSVSKFPVFLRSLETSLDQLNVDSFLLTQTTLEEVFLKVNEDRTE